jgi:hypothetical protein
MSNRKAVANFESTQVIGIIDKTTTIIPTTWEDADRMRACHRFCALGNKSELATAYSLRQRSSAPDAQHQASLLDTNALPLTGSSLRLFR